MNPRPALIMSLLFILSTVTMVTVPAANDDDGLPEWTFMIYLDGDNNLEGAGVEDMNEMEVAGSTDEVNIVAQFDRIDGYDTSNGDWKTAKRFFITKDEKNTEITSQELEDLGEANMGDPTTLVDFVRWAVSDYPAEKYALVLWNHGGAFWGAEWDESNPNDGKDYDVLTLPEMKTAMEGVEDILGRNIDIIAFDACLMGQIAVMYEFRNVADIGIGSGYVEPGDGWPYDKILVPLVQSPSMSPRDLAVRIVDEYVNSYHDTSDDPQDATAITQAAFDLSKYHDLGLAITQFASALAVHSSWVPVAGEGGHWFQMEQARSDTNSYDWGYGAQAAPGNQFPIDPTGYCMYDVIDLAANMRTWMPRENDVRVAADAVTKAAQAVIIHARITGYQDAVKGANGITIYYPSGYDTTYSDTYDDTDMAIETFWDEFLQVYIKKTSVRKTPPAVTISSPADDDRFELDTGQIVVMGSAFDLQGEVDWVEASIDGGEWTKADGTDSWTFKFDTELAGAGNHTITVRAWDGADYSSEISIMVKVYEPEEEGSLFTSTTNVFAPITVIALVAGVALLIIITSRSFISRRRGRQVRSKAPRPVGRKAPVKKGT